MWRAVDRRLHCDPSPPAQSSPEPRENWAPCASQDGLGRRGRRCSDCKGSCGGQSFMTRSSFPHPQLHHPPSSCLPGPLLGLAGTAPSSSAPLCWWHLLGHLRGAAGSCINNQKGTWGSGRQQGAPGVSLHDPSLTPSPKPPRWPQGQGQGRLCHLYVRAMSPEGYSRHSHLLAAASFFTRRLLGPPRPSEPQHPNGGCKNQSSPITPCPDWLS